MIISNERLHKLCNKMGWFTEGTNEQYAKLFSANRYKNADLKELAYMIWICTDTEELGINLDEIYYHLCYETAKEEFELED